MKLGRCQPHVARDAVRQLGIEHYVMLNALMNASLALDLGHASDHTLDSIRVAIAIGRGLEPPEYLRERFNETLGEANEWADGKLPASRAYDGPRSGGR